MRNNVHTQDASSESLKYVASRCTPSKTLSEHTTISELRRSSERAHGMSHLDGHHTLSRNYCAFSQPLQNFVYGAEAIMANVDFFVWRKASIIGLSLCLFEIRPKTLRHSSEHGCVFFVLDFSLRGLQRFSRRSAAMMHYYSKTGPLAKTLVQKCDSSLLAATATLYVLFLSNILPYLYRLSGSLSKRQHL